MAIKNHTKVQRLERAQSLLATLLMKQSRAKDIDAKNAYNEFIHRARAALDKIRDEEHGGQETN